MVRLLWHVEDGLGAFITQNGSVIDPVTGVTHATAEIEVSFSPALLHEVRVFYLARLVQLTINSHGC